MSLRAKYVKEREGFDTLETPDGFAEFKLMKDECYLRDMFVVKEKRRSGLAKSFEEKVEHIARAHGCKYITATVNIQENGSTAGLSFLLSLGFKLAKTESNGIWLFKELK